MPRTGGEPALSSEAGPDEWNSHWDDFGRANERNPAQEYRRRLTLRLLERCGSPARLLDVGSGNGEFLAAASIRWPGAELLGLELSQAAVEHGRRKVPAARFRTCDLLHEPTPEEREAGWATHAACSEVLEHVDDPVALLRNARAWLAPACHIVVTVPGGPMSAFDRHIGHRRHFSPGDLGAVMSAAGLQVLQLEGAGFPFFNLYRSLVVSRGDRLIADARSDADGTPLGLLTRAAMAAFRPLFALNLPRSPFGWQTVGVAVEPLDPAVRLPEAAAP
jgi:SAM-dependent methyltransferase